MFDYLTLIFIIVLIFGFLIGFARGAFRMLAGLAVFGVALLVAILVSKPLAEAALGWPFAKDLNTNLFNFIAGKINISFGAVSITGSTKVTATELEAFSAAGKVYYGDPNYNIFHAAYESIHLPTTFYGTVDGLINDAIATYGNTPFALAQPLADIMTKAICYAGSFLVLFLATCIIGAIVVFVVRHALSIVHPVKGVGSRLVGGTVGLALGIGFVWALCLLINVVLLMDNDLAVHFREVLRYNDPAAWTFAKWLVQTDFGYNAIIQYFVR